MKNANKIMLTALLTAALLVSATGCAKQKTRADGKLGSEITSSENGTEVLVAPDCAVIVSPWSPQLILPLAAAACDEVVGVSQVSPYRAKTHTALEYLSNCTCLRRISVAAARTAVECQTCNVGYQQIAVGVDIYS